MIYNANQLDAGADDFSIATAAAVSATNGVTYVCYTSTRVVVVVDKSEHAVSSCIFVG